MLRRKDEKTPANHQQSRERAIQPNKQKYNKQNNSNAVFKEHITWMYGRDKRIDDRQQTSHIYGHLWNRPTSQAIMTNCDFLEKLEEVDTNYDFFLQRPSFRKGRIIQKHGMARLGWLAAVAFLTS